MLPSFQKDVLPVYKRSNIIYKYLCHCDSVYYVGRTSQRLEEQIQQHVPKFIRNQVRKCYCKSTQNAPISDSGSAVGQHLQDNKVCADNFDINCFSILPV